MTESEKKRYETETVRVYDDFDREARAAGFADLNDGQRYAMLIAAAFTVAVRDDMSAA